MADSDVSHLASEHHRIRRLLLIAKENWGPASGNGVAPSALWDGVIRFWDESGYFSAKRKKQYPSIQLYCKYQRVMETLTAARDLCLRR